MKLWVKSVLIGIALVLGGWLLVFTIAGAILRGILTFLDAIDASEE